jgi:hypothetical protein
LRPRLSGQCLPGIEYGWKWHFRLAQSISRFVVAAVVTKGGCFTRRSLEVLMFVKFPNSALAAAALLGLVSLPSVANANAKNCGVVLDELATAISGHLTMASEKKAAMLRMATKGYDACMSGDVSSSDETRDMVMRAIRESLGQR